MQRLRILQLVHGFPPSENAGTEQVAAGLHERLTARGHAVRTVAATIAPARPMYTRIDAGPVTRIVNNTPARAARRAGADPAVDAHLARIVAEFRPDVIHVQHLAGLSTSLPRSGIPTVWMLHDAWGWCAAGGTLLRRDGRPCGGPGPECAACASAWLTDSHAVDVALGIAARAGRIVPPDVLHRAWKRVPAALRERVTRRPAPALTPRQIVARTDAHRAFARSSTVLAPSRFLAEAAERAGFGPVEVLPHGVDAAPGARAVDADAPFVFLGTLARHKGPDLVRRAWELAGRPAPLRVHGPPGPDPAFVVPNDGPLPHAAVPERLRTARALVLGSIWPENAPLVVLEARAAGCPVIAPAIGGIPELVEDGVDGWLYPAGDAAALAERLTRPLPDRPRPPPTLDAHVDALVAILARVARQKPSRGG